jgi:hypothetical protein|tara:strand:+ start:4116 stop:4466 length:351 start_codon:yes stop_codon:yes gene_type:complete
MESCPNIGGKEIKKRFFATLFGLLLTIITGIYITFFNDGESGFLVIFPALIMGVSFFEVLDKTCIVNAYFGIKNMGDKNQRERDSTYLKIQRSRSTMIIAKGVFMSLVITVIFYII